jgi:hypothetical protein
MSIYRGFVRSLQVRDDGWVETVLQAVHAGNSTETFFIRDLDGDMEVAHKRLAHLSLLRDALARVLPVEIEYEADTKQGNIVEDITLYPRPSIDGRTGNRRIEGTVIGLSISEFGPEGISPYMDKPDLASALILTESGAIELVMLDLQRPDFMTAQAMLALLREAFRTRRPIAVLVMAEYESTKGKKYDTPPGYIQACEWLTVRTEDLDYLNAFVERLGQRYESFASDEASALSHVKVLYTTAPGQTPDGDVSDNGSFTPETKEAWVHSDSPLFARLEAALRDRLMVIIGLKENHVHEVELVGHLGSAARPIWIEVNRSLVPIKDPANLCENVPTIQSVDTQDLNEIPVSLSWRGNAYFNEGIWRFVIKSLNPHSIMIDGKTPCCNTSLIPHQSAELYGDIVAKIDASVSKGYERSRRGTQYHAYLNGMHTVELILRDRTCSQPFQLLAFRIR